MDYSSNALMFLNRHGMSPFSIELESAVPSFLADMRLGLSGRASSLKMIPTYLKSAGAITNGARAAVIDAGGTNFRTARVTFGENGAKIADLAVAPMPGTRGEASWDEFIDFTARRLLPVLEGVDSAGFCFSYPTDETPDLDGRLLQTTKQVRLTGFEDRLICSDLKQRLKELGAGERNIVLLNDTPAVLLSGAPLREKEGYDSLVGLISGTGTNTCMELDGAAIKKPHGDFSGRMLINLESGGFSGLPRGDFDEALDAETSDPGEYRHEKMSSGAYLGTIALLMLRAAAEEGLFHKASNEAILALSSMESPEADALASGNKTLPGADADDVELISELCRAVFERSARCIAANLTAILILTEAGEDPAHPACVCADGSLFRKSRAFRPCLDAAMREFAERRQRFSVFHTFDNATIVGSAAAALLNIDR